MGRWMANAGIIVMAVTIILSVAPSSTGAREIEDTSIRGEELDEILQGFDDPPEKEHKEGEPDDGSDGFSDQPYEDSGREDLDDILNGFEDHDGESGDVTGSMAADKEPSCDLSGTLILGASYGFAHDAPKPGETEYGGLSQLRPDLHLDMDMTFSKAWRAFISGRCFYDLAYGVNGRDNYDDSVLDEYEKEIELYELYVQGNLFDNLDLKMGRQIVVWGKSDTIRVVDVLNPLDNREPGMVDIEDLRLPVTMTKFDYYYRQWDLSIITVHEIRFNRNPVLGSEFFPSTTPFPPEKKPSADLENTQYALSLNGIFSGWDISFYFARYFDDQPHIAAISPSLWEQHHSRLSMIGSAANIALGNWLLKSETAYFHGLESFAQPDDDTSRFDLLAGVEYSGFTDTTISLEAVNRHINGFDSALESLPDRSKEDVFQAVFRYSENFLHDTLHLVILRSWFGLKGKDGAFQRFSLGYDLTDAFSLKAGLVTYQSGDMAQFRQIGDKDRFFLEWRYSF